MDTLLTPSERAAYRRLAEAARKVKTVEELRARKRRNERARKGGKGVDHAHK
jgi:hypothetical protein